MRYYVLASGSKGNATVFVNDENEAILVDCGISKAEIERRMQPYHLTFNQIKKVIITHMHTDHCLSLRAFEPDQVYVHLCTQMSEFHQYDYYQHLEFLGFDFYTLPVSHDSPGTTGFIITYKNRKIAYLTDTGYIHENIQRLMNNCDIYFIESNHDPRMLMLTHRPMYLKQRILSSNGHLSNQDCAYVLGNVMGPKTSQIIFLHRSLEANSEEMIAETFLRIMKQMKVDVSSIRLCIAKQDQVVGSQDESSNVFNQIIKI